MMRLASWVSIVVIAIGVIILISTLSPDKHVFFHDGIEAFNPNVVAGEKLTIFGLVTLTISEVFKCLKDTKSGGRHE